LHRSLSLAGAVFGYAAGWERPYWFARTEQERSLPYTYGPQDWWSVVRREGGELESGVVLFDLTPFTKIDVCGTDALALLQRLCANDVDVEPGRTIYTPMLNRSGGIEADVTVTRCSQDWFRIVSGAPTRRKDLAWVRRSIDADMRIGVFDASSAEVVIAVMGPTSRSLLETLSDEDLSTGAFPFGTSRRIDLAMTYVRATRVSFVGELGWELYVPVEFAEHVYEALLEAGRQFDLGHAGHLCLDGCRLEKGFRHWGHDLGSDLTPLQAGLGFTVSWTKGDFLGREALIRQREDGLDKRLLLFEVTEGMDGSPLLLHDEVIRCDGRIVGFTTSGGLGPRTGRSLAFGLLHCERGTSLGALLQRDYVIEVAGERFQARALSRAPYDSEGRKFRY
jgi:4-methylaminobutanoate oxidase (formaldehyde-forming)